VSEILTLCASNILVFVGDSNNVYHSIATFIYSMDEILKLRTTVSYEYALLEILTLYYSIG
jgi:hypothetical protein